MFRIFALFVFLPALYGAELTVNKYVCQPPSAGAASPDPANVVCTPVSIAQVGALVTYYVAVSNNDTSGNNTVNLTDTLPPGFILVGTPTCQVFGTGAACGTGPQVNGTQVSYTNMTVPSTGRIMIRIDGYFTQTGNPVNKASGGPHTGAVGTNEASKDVSVPTLAISSDLGVTKTVKALSGNRFHYTITVTNNGAAFYPEGVLRLNDEFSLSTAPVAYKILNYVCNPTNQPAGDCPVALSNSSGYFGGTTGYLHQPWTVAAGTSAAPNPFERGASITIEFDMEFDVLCGTGTLAVTNKAFLSMASGEALSDSNAANNSASAGPVKVDYRKDKCGELAKTRREGPTAWGTAQHYTITLTNYSSSAAQIAVADYLSREAGTPPFEVTSISMPVCAPATCTAPVVSAVPVKVLAEYSSYLLFTTTATVPAATSNTPGTLTIDFEIVLKPLSVCQAEPGSRRITNAAYPTWIIDEATKISLPGSAATFQAEPLPKCDFTVTKRVLSGSPLEFGQPVKFQVTYRNNSTETLTMHTLADVMGIDASAWGPLPITMLSSSTCTASGVAPVPTILPGNYSIPHANPATQGPQFVTGGPFTFQPSGQVSCLIEFLPKLPPADDAYCSAAPANLINTAVMDPGVVAMWVSPLKAKNAPVSVPLPKCRKVLIQKSTPKSAYSPGETVIFTILVTNTGNDPLSGLLITDPLPPGFAGQSVVCSSCIGTPTLTGNVLNANLQTVAPGQSNQVTITITATAPATGGNYTNVATVVLPSDKNSFFEGGGLSNEANVQVLTPRLEKEFSKATASFGDILDLTFTIKNTQGEAETGIQFTDTLPPGLLFTQIVSNSCGGQVTLNTANTALTLSTGSLKATDAECQIKVKVKVTACGVLRNQYSKDPAVSNISNTNNIDPSLAIDTIEATNCPPSLTVQKSVPDAPSSLNGTVFKFDVYCVTPSGPIQQEASIVWPATTWSVTGIPAGSTCSVLEKDLPPAPTGYFWTGTETYSPSPTITIKPGGENVIGVRNLLRPCDDKGEVKITKKLENLPPGFAGGTFTFNVFCWLGNTTFTKTVAMTLTSGSATMSVTGMPSGSTCTVTEVSMPSLASYPGWFWLSPGYSPTNGQVVLAPLCCQEVVVTDRAKFCCTVPNPTGTDTPYSGDPANAARGTVPNRPKKR